jgi:hypothetical protein
MLESSAPHLAIPREHPLEVVLPQRPVERLPPVLLGAAAERVPIAIARRSARGPSIARSWGVTDGSTVANLHASGRRTVVTTQKSETGGKPGNQTPNTPDIDESKMSREDRREVDTGRHPGNQSPNTPSNHESDRR